jgi:starch phosphorylase
MGHHHEGVIMAEPKRDKKNGDDNTSIRTGLSEESIRLAFLDNLFYVQGRFLEVASPNDKY